jgi:hypothetical protein
VITNDEIADTVHQAMVMLADACQIIAHYRSRVHLPADDGYLRVATNVSQAAADAADRLVNAARKAGLIDREDRYQ